MAGCVILHAVSYISPDSMRVAPGPCSQYQSAVPLPSGPVLDFPSDGVSPDAHIPSLAGVLPDRASDDTIDQLALHDARGLLALPHALERIAMSGEAQFLHAARDASIQIFADGRHQQGGAQGKDVG